MADDSRLHNVFPIDRPQETIVVLDFGGPSSLSVARKLREWQLFAEVLPAETSARDVQNRSPKGIILSGYVENAKSQGVATKATLRPEIDPALFGLGIPILGVGSGAARQIQYAVGRPADPIGSSGEEPPRASGEVGQKLYRAAGPTHATGGEDLDVALRRFALDVCGCESNWTITSYIEGATRHIRREVGAEGRAVCGLSGGVDSTTAAVLVHRAIGDRLTCIFVDHGLLRKGEADEVMRLCQDEYGMRVIRVDAETRFLSRLQGVTDPEQKRKRIGEEFIRIFEEEADRVGDVDFLVQGTLYPDVIESARGGDAAPKVKSHHNVGGLPDVMRLRLLEPLRFLFKDEVRRVGTELGIPDDLVWRQPFPGPGLAVRIIGEVTDAKLTAVREADAIFTEELERAGLGRDVWQYFAVLTDTRTVGMTSEGRTYGHLVALRAITSAEGMTADWVRLPYDLLDRAAHRIAHEVEGISRVVYDVTGKPPGTIEWE